MATTVKVYELPIQELMCSKCVQVCVCVQRRVMYANLSLSHSYKQSITQDVIQRRQ